MTIKLKQFNDSENYFLTNKTGWQSFDNCLSTQDLISLYKQIQSMIIDEVIEEYDPSKKRAINEDI